MAIKNGELANADDVLNAIGSNFNDNAQMIFNADYIGFDSRLYNTGTPNLKNVDYSTFTSDDGDTGTTMEYDSIGDFYFVLGDEIDRCDDSSVDTTLWSEVGAGTLAETTYLTSGNITNNTSTIFLDQASAPNLKDGDSTVYVQSRFYATGGNTGKSGSLQITDGTNNVTIKGYSVSGTSTYNETHIWRIDIDVSAETMTVYEDGTVIATDTDISSLTGSTWNLKWTTNCGSVDSPTTNIRIYYVYQITDSTTVTGLYYSPDHTASETITNAIFVVNEDLTTNAFGTYYLSADGGSNYEEVTPNEIHRFTNTGTTLKVKIEGDPNKQTDVFDNYYLTEYAVKYNFY